MTRFCTQVLLQQTNRAVDEQCCARGRSTHRQEIVQGTGVSVFNHGGSFARQASAAGCEDAACRAKRSPMLGSAKTSGVQCLLDTLL